MIRLFRKIRNQLLAEDRYSTYFLYASGEVLLVVVGILLALQIDNWNQHRIDKKVEIENIENLYFSFNEDIQIKDMITLYEDASFSERMWLDYLEGKIPYSDSLLNYGYLIGVNSSLIPNKGFYESLKTRGLETIENKELRNRITTVYELYFPLFQRQTDFFEEQFGKERIDFFKKYFLLGNQFNNDMAGILPFHFDYSYYKIEGLKNRETMKQDREFEEFVRFSYLFHQNLLGILNRELSNVQDIQSRISYELNYLKYGKPKRKKVTFELKGYRKAANVVVSGEFNNWVTNESMLQTPKGWERSYELFPGSYEYKFVIEGETWILDPANPDSVFVPERNLYNSLLTVSE